MGKLNNLSVVIPAYNEAERLKETLPLAAEYLNNRFDEYEVIVVDDGSFDNTVEVAGSFSDMIKDLRVISNGVNRGKGYSVRHGVSLAKYPYVLMTDADFSTPIEDLERLEEFAADDTLVIGSRATRDAKILKHQPKYRELMGKTFNLIVQALVIPGIHDTQCGFKLLGPEVKRLVIPKMTVDGFAFDVEMLLLAKKANLKVIEVGVRWKNDERTKVRTLQHSLNMLKDVILIRMKHLLK